MKLRIEEKSIRIRLTGDEFDLIHAGNRLSEKIELEHDNQFSFVLSPGNYSAIQAQFLPYRLEVRIPFSILKNWAKSGETGITGGNKNEQDTGRPVIIVEKDLPPRRKKTD